MSEIHTSAKRLPKRYDVPPGLILDVNQRYSVPEGAAILRQSVAKTWKDIRDGKLQAIKDGARTYLRGSSLIRALRHRTRPDSDAR